MKEDFSWILRIRNAHLLKAAVNLHCVGTAAGELAAKTELSHRKIGVYEMKMISDAINEIRHVMGGNWDKFPLPSFGDGELATFDPLPETVSQYCGILLAYVQNKLGELDK